MAIDELDVAAKAAIATWRAAGGGRARVPGRWPRAVFDEWSRSRAKRKWKLMACEGDDGLYVIYIVGDSSAEHDDLVNVVRNRIWTMLDALIKLDDMRYWIEEDDWQDWRALSDQARREAAFVDGNGRRVDWEMTATPARPSRPSKRSRRVVKEPDWICSVHANRHDRGLSLGLAYGNESWPEAIIETKEMITGTGERTSLALTVKVEVGDAKNDPELTLFVATPPASDEPARVDAYAFGRFSHVAPVQPSRRRPLDPLDYATTPADEPLPLLHARRDKRDDVVVFHDTQTVKLPLGRALFTPPYEDMSDSLLGQLSPAALEALRAGTGVLDLGDLRGRIIALFAELTKGGLARGKRTSDAAPAADKKRRKRQRQKADRRAREDTKAELPSRVEAGAAEMTTAKVNGKGKGRARH